MSIKIFILASSVNLKNDQFDNVLVALQALQGRETTGRSDYSHFMWLPCCDFNNVQSVEEMFKLWRWPVEFNEAGDIVSLDFVGEKSGDEDLLFATIAPYVRCRSENIVVSEDYEIWRWLFSGFACEKQYGRVVFGE